MKNFLIRSEELTEDKVPSNNQFYSTYLVIWIYQTPNNNWEFLIAVNENMPFKNMVIEIFEGDKNYSETDYSSYRLCYISCLIAAMKFETLIKNLIINGS